MSNCIGTSTIYGSILPNNASLARIARINNLSAEAKRRLSYIDHYLRVSHNVSLTCRHFAIPRSLFYKWYKRFNPRNLLTLESRSCKPHQTRTTQYDHKLVALVRRLRNERPSYSSKKLAVILCRDFDLEYSHSTIGRIIQKYKLYFRAAMILAKRRSKRAAAVWKRRKPYNLTTTQANHLIEFDMKHIYLQGMKFYAFVAVDVYTKQILIHVSRQPNSYQARIALERVVEVFGNQICIINDNGSENLKHAYSYLQSHNITQYFARPHTPKDKPHVENVIGKLQQECLDEDRSQKSLDELRAQISAWVNDYHFYRPHQALNYLTPQEFCDTLDITIVRV